MNGVESLRSQTCGILGGILVGVKLMRSSAGILLSDVKKGLVRRVQERARIFSVESQYEPDLRFVMHVHTVRCARKTRARPKQ